MEVIAIPQISLQTAVKKTSHNVAKRFQIKDRGYIREGYYADLVILDIDNCPPKIRDLASYIVANTNTMYIKASGRIAQLGEQLLDTQ